MTRVSHYTDVEMADRGPCRGCGALTPYVLLDGKPRPGANPETADWDQLFCERCYGPGWLPT